MKEMKAELAKKLIDRFLERSIEGDYGYFDILYVNDRGETIGGALMWDRYEKRYYIKNNSVTINNREITEKDIDEFLAREERQIGWDNKFVWKDRGRDELFVRFVYFSEKLEYRRINGMYAYLNKIGRFFKLGDKIHNAYTLDRKYNKAIWYFKRRRRYFYWEDDALEEYEKIKNISQDQKIF